MQHNIDELFTKLSWDHRLAIKYMSGKSIERLKPAIEQLLEDFEVVWANGEDPEVEKVKIINIQWMNCMAEYFMRMHRYWTIGRLKKEVIRFFNVDNERISIFTKKFRIGKPSFFLYDARWNTDKVYAEIEDYTTENISSEPNELETSMNVKTKTYRFTYGARYDNIRIKSTMNWTIVKTILQAR
jgi:hypothetical protein